MIFEWIDMMATKRKDECRVTQCVETLRSTEERKFQWNVLEDVGVIVAST